MNLFITDNNQDTSLASSLVLAACAPIALAIPISNSSTALSAPVSNSSSPYDPVFLYLAANNQLNWTEMNGGHGVTIPNEHWAAAKEATGFKSPVSKRDGGGGNEGPINGLVPNVFCYHTGSVTRDENIQNYAINACDSLLHKVLPKPAVNAWQFWSTVDFADPNGVQSYLRYGYEILNQSSEGADQSLCEQAMDLYTQYCQSCRFTGFAGERCTDSKIATGETRGGEVVVGDAYRFLVDPTDTDTNN